MYTIIINYPFCMMAMFTYFSSFFSHVILKVPFKYPLPRLKMFQFSLDLGLVLPGKSVWRKGSARQVSVSHCLSHSWPATLALSVTCSQPSWLAESMREKRRRFCISSHGESCTFPGGKIRSKLSCFFGENARREQAKPAGRTAWCWTIVGSHPCRGNGKHFKKHCSPLYSRDFTRSCF